MVKNLPVGGDFFSSDKYFIMLWGGSVHGNKLENNIFWTDRNDMYAIYTPKLTGAAANFMDYNVWYMPNSNRWYWINADRNDFKEQYRNVTGYDTHGIFGDALFKNVIGKDYHLTSTSPARNKGTNTQCPATDYVGTTRSQESICDIGAYEYKP